MRKFNLIPFLFLMSSFCISQSKVNCIQREEKNSESQDPRIVKTCTYGVYKSVRTGEADEKGRYSYFTKLYKQVNGKYAAISNAQLFNQKKEQLLGIIRNKIDAYHDELARNPDNQDCLIEKEYLPVFTFDNLDFSFVEDGLEVSFSLGLSGACMSVDGDIISFKLAEIEPYLMR
jgi:hypothetical protein